MHKHDTILSLSLTLMGINMAKIVPVIHIKATPLKTALTKSLPVKEETKY